jgi:peptidoglycan/xylan/chitin deacetylase (PgdA/CDA1 family)
MRSFKIGRAGACLMKFEKVTMTVACERARWLQCHYEKDTSMETNSPLQVTRRTLIAGTVAATASAAVAKSESFSAGAEPFWPGGARLAVSLSLMFEGGGQPVSGAGGPITEPIVDDLPDFPTNAFFQYAVYEGIPRILDLMDKHQIELSSFMIGKAIEKAPELAREIVKRGHEAAAHGRTWQRSYDMTPEAERRHIADSVASIERITGVRPVGWNAYWLRNSVHTMDILQSLGFFYHVDEPSADQPFLIKLKGGDFMTVPYTLHMNDIASFPFLNYDPAAHEQALRDEFHQLYEEGATRRRMMVFSLHDRISGHANRVRVLDRFLTYAKTKPGVWFARKDEIAKWAYEHRSHTPIYERGDPSVTGLAGSAV